MGDLLLLGAAFLFGIGSALLPMFLNAELYVIAMGALVPRGMLAVVILVLVIGTVVGKFFVFELARKGTSKLRKVERGPSRNRFTAWIRKVSDWLLTLLDRPYEGGLTVLVSSLLGVPPLAIVTIMAGASKQPRWLFLLMVFIGRLVQFLFIAFVIHKAT